MVLAGFGMACGQQPKSASQAASPSKAAAPSTATRQVAIIDPALRMEAISLQIPADWIFEGAMVAGPSCASASRFVYRAVSPDGISQFKTLPSLSWSWGQPPQPGASAQKSNDCLGWNKEVPAAEFAKYMINLLPVEFVRDAPIPGPVMTQFQENEKKQNEWFAARTQPGQPVASVKGDLASATVRYKINSIPVEETLGVAVNCMDIPTFVASTWSQTQPGQLLPSGWTHVHTCTGFVSRSRARQGNLESMRPVFEAISKSVVVNQQWQQQWTKAVEDFGAAMRAHAAIIGAQQIANSDARESQMLRINAQQSAAHDMQLRQQQEMTAVTREGAQRAIGRDQEATAAQSGMAHDWADFALDQQKRMDPNTGKVSKDSSAYSYTWVDQSGQRQQTNDINYNPNGLLKGNWTLQTNVR
jgi:hypothetical protein